MSAPGISAAGASAVGESFRTQIVALASEVSSPGVALDVALAIVAGAALGYRDLAEQSGVGAADSDARLSAAVTAPARSCGTGKTA